MMAYLLRSSNNILRLYTSKVLQFRFLSSTTSIQKGLVLGAYTDDNNNVALTPAAAKFNDICNGRLIEQIALAGNKIKAGQSLVFWGLNKEYPAVAVSGLGKKNQEVDECELICHEKESVRIAASAGCRSLASIEIANISVEDFCDAESSAEGAFLGTWKFQEYNTKKKELPTIEPYNLCENNLVRWQRGAIKGTAQNLTRKLTDTPSNFLTPTIFAEEIKNILEPLRIQVEVHDKEWAKQEKMNAFLSVTKGSVEPPKFVEITYNNSCKKESPYVLVGKGVTFDSGGISIKPSAAMDEMRGDMGGAAAVVGCIFGLAKLNSPVHIKALLPLVENMPSGSATKPGDVFFARNGKTICVDNTDAEGRLILADALCYGADFNPKWILDIATLTGAMRVALGDGATGVFTNSNRLYSLLECSGSYTGDRVWRMPLWKHYTNQVAKNTAYDLNNIAKGAKGGGSCTAAAFLREFVPKKTDWLHLDIAGVMGVKDAAPYLYPGMTGRPTRTLIQFLECQQ